jgi:hypothetical protein
MRSVTGNRRLNGKGVFDASNRISPGHHSLHCFIAREHPMLDVILVAVALGFFALSIGYTIACDRL